MTYAEPAGGTLGLGPQYRTWIRMRRVRIITATASACLAASALAALSPWFLLFLLPAGILGYVSLILWLTVHRLGPRGGDVQQRIHRLIAAKVGERPGSVLDIGCGSGSLAIAVATAQPDCNVVGVDSWGDDWEYSQRQCEQNARCLGVADRVAFRQQSAASLGYPDGAFDTVVSCLTFHEVREATDRTEAVLEALRVLRPGGRFVFLDLFADRGHFTSRQHVRDAIGRGGGSIDQERALSDVMPLPYPLRDAKVLGHAVLLSGVRTR